MIARCGLLGGGFGRCGSSKLPSKANEGGCCLGRVCAWFWTSEKQAVVFRFVTLICALVPGESLLHRFVYGSEKSMAAVVRKIPVLRPLESFNGGWQLQFLAHAKEWF